MEALLAAPATPADGLTLAHEGAVALGLLLKGGCGIHCVLQRLCAWLVRDLCRCALGLWTGHIEARNTPAQHVAMRSQTVHCQEPDALGQKSLFMLAFLMILVDHTAYRVLKYRSEVAKPRAVRYGR